MDSCSNTPISTIARLPQNTEMLADVLRQLGKLQADFVLGKDVLLPLCDVFAALSGADAVLFVDEKMLNSTDMPTNAACWCRDPVKYLTLWNDVKEWADYRRVLEVHSWKRFVVWPVVDAKVVVFFQNPKPSWSEFLQQAHSLVSDILSGIFLQQAQNWQSSDPSAVASTLEDGLFQSIVSNSEDLILVVRRELGGQYVIVYSNAAATCISEYPRAKLVGKSISMLFSEPCDSNNEIEQQALVDALVSHEDFDGEIWCTKANGLQVLLHLHMVPLDSSHESGLLFAIVGRDFTVQKQLQQTISRTQKMQAIGQLVGGIAHDFNNILGVLSGNLELMQLKNIDEKLERYLQSAFKSCRRGTDLTRRLLQFSRQEQFNAQSCQINDIIKEMKELLAKSLTSQIRLDVALTEQIPLITVDKGDFEDALLNLVLNARDAMQGEGILRIATGSSTLSGFLPGASDRVVVDPGLYTWVSVIDSGSGIPVELIDKIFEPFFTTKEKSKGTGLGLAMVYGFVKRSRGYMSVLKTNATGTEFRLWFPSSKETSSTMQTDEVEATTHPCVKGSLKALLVDDESELLNVLREYCQYLGIEVEAYSDPLMVLDKYAHSGCDAQLLITDVLMPGGINGYELASQLARRYPLSVLLISGYIQDIGVNHLDEMPYKVLHKPFDLKSFISALQEVGVQFNQGEH